MKVYILKNVLCDYTCGCIVVAAKNKKEAAEIIMEKRGGQIYSGGEVYWDNIEEHLEEVTRGCYFEVFGGG